MTDQELFPDSEVAVDSPRLLWLKANNLACGQLPDGSWYCVGDMDGIAYGESARDAELNYCKVGNGYVVHWEITEFQKAIAPIEKVMEELE